MHEKFLKKLDLTNGFYMKEYCYETHSSCQRGGPHAVDSLSLFAIAAVILGS